MSQRVATKARQLAIASTAGLASGGLAVAVFFAMLYLYGFRAPDHPGFVVIGMPLGYAVTVVVIARYIAANGHDISRKTVIFGVALGVLVGICAVFVAAFILAFTAMLRPPYMAGLLFLLVGGSVALYLGTRPS